MGIKNRQWYRYYHFSAFVKNLNELNQRANFSFLFISLLICSYKSLCHEISLKQKQWDGANFFVIRHLL